MDVCIMRNYGNYVPREHLRFEHAVLLLHEHKDDLFLNVMDKYLRYSAHVTVLVSCKKGKSGTFYQDNVNAQQFSSRLRETVQFIPSAQSYIEKHYTAMYRPSITVTDDLDSETYMPKYCPQYFNYASNHFCQLNVSDNIQGLNLAHPIDLSRFDHQLSLFTGNYLRHKICIKTIIQILPPCFVFFTAFGDYKEPFRFQEAINAFILFKHKYDKYLGHEIMLILGGEYFQTGSDDDKYRRYLRSSLESVKKDHNVIFLKKALNQSEKKTLLRLSYAALYLHDRPDFDDIKFTMSLGTPIICSNAGYAANMVVHGVSGFRVDLDRIDHIAACMETLSLPSVYHRFSSAARNVYLKNYSEMSMFLNTVSVKEIPDFNRPEMAINPALFSNSANSEFPQSVNSFDLQNDWYVSNEYSVDGDNPSVFDEGDARIEYENHMQFCKQQLPQQKQFYVKPNEDFPIDISSHPRWSEEDEVCDQMFGDHLFEVETVEGVTIKDPALQEVLNETEVIPPQEVSSAGFESNQSLQPYQPQPIGTFEPFPPAEPFQRLTFGNYQRTSIEPTASSVLADLLESQRLQPQESSFLANKSPFSGVYKPPGTQQQSSLFEQNQPPLAGMYRPGCEQQSLPIEQGKNPFGGMYKSSNIEQQSLPLLEPYEVPMFKPFEPPPVEPIQPPRFKNQFSLTELNQFSRTERQSIPLKLNQPPFVNLFQTPGTDSRNASLPIQSTSMERQPSPFELNQISYPEMCQSPHSDDDPLLRSSSTEPQVPIIVQSEMSFGARVDRQIAALKKLKSSGNLPGKENNSGLERKTSPFLQNKTVNKESVKTQRVERQPSPVRPRCSSPFSYFSSNKASQTKPAEPYQPPPFKTYQSPFDQLYEPPSIKSLFASSTATSSQSTSDSNEALLRDQPIESIQNQDIEQRQNQQQNQEMLQRINQSLQQFQNEPIQHFRNEAMQQLQNQRMEALKETLQQFLNRPMGTTMQQVQSPLVQQLQLQTQQTLQLQNQQMRQLAIQALQQPLHQAKNLPMEQLQYKPLQPFQDQTLQQPMQNLQQLQNNLTQPMPQLPTLQQRIDQAIEQHKKEVMQSYQATQLQLNQSMQLRSNQAVSAFPTMQPSADIQQLQNLQLQQVLNQPMPQLDTLQQRLDHAIQMQRKEAIQHYQPQQGHSKQTLQLHPNQVLQPFQNLQPISEKIFQTFPPMVPLNQSQQQFLPLHSFSNQPIQASQVLPKPRIQSPQTLLNQTVQPNHILLNQPIQAAHVLQNQQLLPPQVFLNHSTSPPQILSNQPTQSTSILPTQAIQPAQFLTKQPVIMLNQSQAMPNQTIQPLQIISNQSIQSSQTVLNSAIQPLQSLSNSTIQLSQSTQNQLIQTPRTKPNQPMGALQAMNQQPMQVISNQQQMQSLLNQQALQVMSNQQTVQAMQNQQALQAMPNQQTMQALSNQQTVQALPNQQPIRPYYVGIMPQVMPMKNYPRPQFMAPNQPGLWLPMTPVQPPKTEPQSSGSEYSTPRQFFEHEEPRVVECDDSDTNDVYEEPTQRWEEVFANDSLDDVSVHGSELSETREDAWSGICSDDSPSSGNKSWHVFSSSYRSNSQYSDDTWGQAANQDSGEETAMHHQHQEKPEASTSGKVDKATAAEEKVACRECRDEQCIKELHAKVDAKLENNQGIDTTFQKRSKSARRKAKRRMKKIQPESSD